MNKDTPQSDPVSDFFNAPDEVKRPVYEKALEKAQEEQSNTDWREELDRLSNIYDWHHEKCSGHAHFPSCPVVKLRRTIEVNISQLLEAEKKRWREVVNSEITEEPLYVGQTQYDFYKGDVRWVANQALDSVLQKLS